jgi:D-alanyl-D-alanine carboxypeptidase (penicillin-binding protein 5/6)
MKKFAKFLIILLMTVLLLAEPFTGISVQATEFDPGLTLNSEAVALINLDTGTPVYTKNGNARMYPASVTKIAVAMMLLESVQDDLNKLHDIDVTLRPYMVDYLYQTNSSLSGLQKNETLSAEQMLHCMMIASGNDAAMAIADYLGNGSIDAFVAQMNARLKEIGCRDTNFTNPHGLHDDNHYTTANDMAKIIQHILSSSYADKFMSVCTTKAYVLGPSNVRKKNMTVYSTNGMHLSSSKYYYSYTQGVKTGSTTEAGKCLVAAARDGDKVMISVIMGAGPITDADGNERFGQFDESKRLLEYGLLNFRRVTLTQPDEVVANVAVTLSEDGTEVGVKPRGSVSLMLPNMFSQNDVQTQVFLFADTVEAPVEEGQVMGTMRLYVNDLELGELELVAERSLEYSNKLLRKEKRQDFMNRIGKKILIGFFILLLLPLVALVALRCINVYRRKQRKKRAAQRRAAQQARRPKQ